MAVNPKLDLREPATRRKFASVQDEQRFFQSKQRERQIIEERRRQLKQRKSK